MSFLQDLRGLLKQLFKKNGYLPNEKKVDVFFLLLSSMEDLMEHFFVSTRYFGDDCASFQLISPTPNWLMKTQISEKCSIFFSATKKCLPIFSSFIAYGKRQETI